MIEPEVEPSFEPDAALRPLRRARSQASAAPPEAVAAAEETVRAAGTGEAAAGWNGVISRAVIALSPLVFFR